MKGENRGAKWGGELCKQFNKSGIVVREVGCNV